MTSAIRLLRLFLLYFGVLILMTLFTVLANIIPNKPIWNHVAGSLPSEDFVMSPGNLVALDQFTECIALTIGLTPSDISVGPLIRTFGSPTLGSCQVSKKTLAMELGGPYYDPLYYWRYWHGYQILSRPILTLSDVKTLRLVVFVLVCTSLLFFVGAVSKVLSTTYAFIFLMSLLSTPLYSQFLLISHSGVWVIGLTFASLLLFAVRDRRRFFERYCLEMFFVTGMLTAYVDILTAPLITLTIPLMVLYWRGAWPWTPGLRSSTAAAVVLCICWAVGYAFCWLAKWIGAAIFLKSAVIAEAASVTLHRLSGNIPGVAEGGATSLKSIYDNFIQSRNGFLIVGIAVVLRLLLICRYPLRATRSIDELATLAWIVLLPVIWLALVRNHSIIHVWFVAPILIPSFALLLGTLWPAERNLVEGPKTAGYGFMAKPTESDR